MTNGILLTRHNQEIAQWSPDPFPRERVGSGDETRSNMNVIVADDRRFKEICFTDHSEDLVIYCNTR